MSYMSEGKKIIMNFTHPPSLNDFEEIIADMLDALPDELVEFCDDLGCQIEDFPDEMTEQELDVDDPYELLALYKSGKEISPGVEHKTSGEDDLLIIYRRPVLDMWCESGESLGALLWHIVIEEIGRQFEFSSDEISDMIQNCRIDLL